MLFVFGEQDEAAKDSCAELLRRLATHGGASLSSAIATRVAEAIQSYGDDERLEALLEKLGGAPAAGPRAPSAPPVKREVTMQGGCRCGGRSLVAGVGGR
jgi:hypothetical protein